MGLVKKYTISVLKTANYTFEELKSEIDAKIQMKGVKSYSLKIVPNEDVKDVKVIGTCDGGTKKIVYKRGE